jgi:acyl-CoA synthetase (AMP-forming)/AMP-acid ligase II
MRTGDLIRFDKDGFAYFVGRAKDMVKTGGENVSALEVEIGILEHPDVSEAAAYGTPHDYWGEELRAAVVAVPGRSIDLEALHQFCRGRLTATKVPKRLPS